MAESGGYFLSFEGTDGCGKSTQLDLTAEWLRSKGREVLVTFEPGDTPIGKEIRRLLLAGEHTPAAETELFLFLADRAQHVRDVIVPALKAGAWVLCDRYSDSTLAYQLAGRQLVSHEGLLRDMVRMAELDTRPDLTFWLDAPVDKALKRIRRRSQKGEKSTRMDDEALLFHKKVYQAFKTQWQQEAPRIVRVDSSGTLEGAQQTIRQACLPLCEESG
ncbi:MAG: dTMP kinase [Mariprofundaceae bacterium]